MLSWSLYSKILPLAFSSLLLACATADIVLLGLDPPRKSVKDGDFDLIWSGRRDFRQSPFWETKNIPGQGTMKMGIDHGRMSGGGNKAMEVRSVLLDPPSYPAPIAGDTLVWSYAGKGEYPCQNKVTFSLLFGERERQLSQEENLPCGPANSAVFSGSYTITEEDVRGGSLSAKFTLHASHSIKVFIEYVDLKVLKPQATRPHDLKIELIDGKAHLSWKDDVKDGEYEIYRSRSLRKGFQALKKNLKESSFVDQSFVHGLTTYYCVTRISPTPSPTSEVISISQKDNIAPQAPLIHKAELAEASVTLRWHAQGKDLAGFHVYRSIDGEKTFERIAKIGNARHFVDHLPAKNVLNYYALKAIDHSGNISAQSPSFKTKVSAVRGASFSDLIKPMPIHKSLRSDLWGTPEVLPRDPDNGIEHPDWSYWGGKIIHDPSDGKYHILIARWPEGARKGHWEWPYSTVAHVTADKPTGPYQVVSDTAYSFDQGLGHNPNITRLNDGRYMLHLWKSHVMTSTTMNGPWKYEGKMTYEYDRSEPGDPKEYQYIANLSGIQREDGSILIVSKFGRMMLSENGILGPYKVITQSINQNETVPKSDRNINYEDPTMWRDEVQYHMLINAFLLKRAIYLRSPDGIHWKCDTGYAYTPDVTLYEDGTRTSWYKLERPNVLEDKFGRATHLSLAATDIKKNDDYGNDGHSTKHLVLPLVVHKRLTILNTEKIDATTKSIKVLIRAEEGFNPETDLDLKSLRYGASEEVNFGRGSQIINTESHPDGLILEFDAKQHGLTDENFAGKLLGKGKDDQLIIAFSKLPH